MNLKSKKLKLLSSSIMILLTATVLTASTYAWFTANTKANFEEINVNVTATNSLQISVNGIDWKSSIAEDDIKDAINNKYSGAVNQIPSLTSALIPVSTAGTIDTTTGFLNFYTGTVKSSTTTTSYNLTATKTEPEKNGITGKFIAFDMFFQVTKESQIYLTDQANIIYKKPSSGLADNGIANSARTAFIEQGNLPTGSSSSDIQSLKATEQKIFNLWEPNYDIHTQAAVDNAKENYNITTTTTDAKRIMYYGIDSEISEENNISTDSTEEPFLKLTNPTIFSKATGFDNNTPVFTLKAGVTKMRIYMWVEGQDVDCENGAAGGAITYNLAFTV